MAKMYGAVVTVSRTTADGWLSTTSSPTFFLDGNVQGLMSTEAASRVAVRMFAEVAGEGAVVTATVWAADASEAPFSTAGEAE